MSVCSNSLLFKNVNVSSLCGVCDKLEFFPGDAKLKYLHLSIISAGTEVYVKVESDGVKDFLWWVIYFPQRGCYYRICSN